MKKYLLLLASAALLLVGCQKEKFADQQEGGMTTATFTASLENGVATKADADNDGDGTNVNRCIMEIYFQNELYTRLVQPVTPAAGEAKAYATFANVPVVAGKQYQVLFWADCGGDGQIDKYYTTKTEGVGNKGLKAVTVNKTNFIDALKSKKNDELDAFFFADNYTVPQAGVSKTVTLKRPFAQLNVITTDINKSVTSEALLPDKVSVSYTAADVFDVATGAISSSKEDGSYTTYTYEADVYGTWSDTKTELTLSMDYLLASTEQGLVNVTFITKNNGAAVMTHNLANLPYQRNYRTNVKGDLLTAGGSWKAEIEPKWGNGTDTGEIDHIIAATYTEADLALKNAQANGQDKLKIELTQKAVDQMTVDETGRYKRTDVEGVGTALQFILYKTGPVDLVEFELPVLPTGINAWIIEFEADYPTQEVAVNTAEDESKVIINAPNSSVTLNDHVYSYVSSMTAENTLIVPEDVTINELKVVQGNVLVYGIVKSGAVTYADGCTLFHGIRSDISVDNLNNSIAGTAGEWKSNIVKIAHDGKLTDGKTFTVPSGKDVIIEGEATLAGQLKIANSAKVTVKSGTFADVLTFTGSQVAVEGGRFNDIVAEEATGFITGGLFQTEPKAEYVNPQYEVIDNEDPATKAVWPYTVGAGTAYVAKIGTKLYMTFNDALNDVQNGETIVILKNTAGWTGAQCSKNGNFTVDFNGHTLSTGSLHGPLCFQQGNPTITFTDSKTGGGAVALYPDGGHSDQFAAVSIAPGNVTIKGGNYSAPDGYNVLYAQSGNLSVHGGKFTGNIYGEVNISAGEFKVNPIEFIVSAKCWYDASSSHPFVVASTLPDGFITTATVKTASNKMEYFQTAEGPNQAVSIAPAGSTVTIKAGQTASANKVLANAGETLIIALEEGASYTGTVSTSLDANKFYVATETIAERTTKYTVAVNWGSAEASIGDKAYATLDLALNAAVANDVIVLRNNVSRGFLETTQPNNAKWDIKRNISLDLNGYSILSTGDNGYTFALNSNIHFTILDSKGGGKIENKKNESNKAIIAAGQSSTLTIQGGIFEHKTANSDKCIWVAKSYATVEISGGKFQGTAITIDSYWGKNSNASISGGLFEKQPDANYIASGYKVASNTDDETKEQYPYTVVAE